MNADDAKQAGHRVITQLRTTGTVSEAALRALGKAVGCSDPEVRHSILDVAELSRQVGKPICFGRETALEHAHSLGFTASRIGSLRTTCGYPTLLRELLMRSARSKEIVVLWIEGNDESLTVGSVWQPPASDE